MRVPAIAVVSVWLCSCVPTPESYSLPPQHPPLPPRTAQDKPAATANLGESVNAADPGADIYFVKDVKPSEGGPSRWTYAEPELRFLIKKPENRVFHLEFGINDRTFKETGPLRIVFLVNGRELERTTWNNFGDQVYEKAVPADWLKGWGENRITIRVLNPWKAQDGVRLGILLQSASLAEVK